MPEREFQIREADPVPLSFLGPIGVIGEAIASIVNPAYNRPLTQILGLGAPSVAAVPTMPAAPFYGGAGYPGMGGFVPAAAMGPAIRTLAPRLAPYAQTAARWARRILQQYGPVIGFAIVNEAQRNREKGLTVYDSHRAAEYTHAGTVTTTRRRMNPANIRALRRAVRRVRSARRVMSKVRGVFPSRAGGRGHSHYHRHPRRRGDVDPFFVEDRADVYDEAEDLGYDPGSFREDDIE